VMDESAQHATLAEFSTAKPPSPPSVFPFCQRTATMASRKNNLSNSGWFFLPLAALLARCRSLRICASHAPRPRPKFLRPSCIILFFRDAYPCAHYPIFGWGLHVIFAEKT
jgi:hypothetical protein